MSCGIRQRSTPPLLSAGQLEHMGVAVVTYPRILTAAAIKGMQNVLGVLRRSLDSAEVIGRPDLLVSFDEINNLMGLPQLRDLEGRYRSAADRERNMAQGIPEQPSSVGT